jgi:hypothetical protein
VSLTIGPGWLRSSTCSGSASQRFIVSACSFSFSDFRSPSSLSRMGSPEWITNRRPRTHLQIILDGMPHHHPPFYELRDLLLHMLKYRRADEIALPHAGYPRAPIGHPFAGLDERVEKDVAVVVDKRDAGEGGFGA